MWVARALTTREPPWKQNGLPTMVNTMQIASAKFRSVRGASHQPAFMSSCPTISHPFHLPNYLVTPIYLVHEESWCSMVSYDWVNGGSVGVFFGHGMVSGLWGELVLF